MDSFDITPKDFNISSPSNGSSLNDPTPEFTWTASEDDTSGLAKYQLYVDDILIGDNLSTSVTSFEIPTALSNGDHTWYVKAVNNAGQSVLSASSYSFNINVPIIPDVTDEEDETTYSYDDVAEPLEEKIPEEYPVEKEENPVGDTNNDTNVEDDNEEKSQSVLPTLLTIGAGVIFVSGGFLVIRRLRRGL